MIRSRLHYVLPLAGLLFVTPAQADESQILAQAGRATWFGMMCARYADDAGLKPEEASRLMEYGYRQGQRFFAGVFANKVKQEDITKTLPIGMTFGMGGPNAEFVLGRLFERTEREVFDSISEVINLNSILSTGKDASYDAKQNKFSRRAAALEKYESLKCSDWAKQSQREARP
jgi:hypothetical protein